MNAEASPYSAITKPPNWHGLVAWDMLFNNLTTGLFLVTALGELAVPTVFGPLTKIAYPVAWLFLMADLLCLVLDLGDPWRFHHMLRVFKPGSPMSLGTWCLTVYSLPLTVLVVVDWLPLGEMAGWVHHTAVIVGVLPAFGAALYKGVLFSTTAQPGWKEARWLGAYLTTSAFLFGAAGLFLLSIVFGPEKAAAMLQSVLVFLLLLNAAALLLVVAEVRMVVSAEKSRREIAWTGLMIFGGGFLVPLGLSIVGGQMGATMAVGLVLLAAIHIRYEIVRLPHRRTTAESRAS
jgi:hypothetical protein